MSPVYEVEDFERTVVPAVVEKVCVGENGTRPTKVIRRLQKVLIEEIFFFKVNLIITCINVLMDSYHSIAI